MHLIMILLPELVANRKNFVVVETLDSIPEGLTVDAGGIIGSRCSKNS
jgi:hypothetical protein